MVDPVFVFSVASSCGDAPHSTFSTHGWLVWEWFCEHVRKGDSFSVSVIGPGKYYREKYHFRHNRNGSYEFH